MKKNLCVGILRESKAFERRAPLAPDDAGWLVKRGVEVEVESSASRVFKDQEYKKNGAKIVDKFRNAELLLGIKEPRTEDLYRNKIYMVFPHTAKGQSQNMPLLKACLEKGVTLIDYEKIVDLRGRRLVYFGRFAGICGLVDSLYYLGKKLEWEGIKSPFLSLKPAHKYDSLKDLKQAMVKAGEEIKGQGFKGRSAPFIIGITGHGHVSGGVQEILEPLDPVEIHPRDMLRFIKRQKGMRDKIYKIVFLREEKIRAKNGRGFYFENYLDHPEKFESNLDIYLPYINLLVHASYWDKRYPRMVTKELAHRLARRKTFRLEFIGDISCDINGSIELTYKVTTPDKPTFTYDPKKKRFVDGYKSQGITILAIDNLPSELPKDASAEFSGFIRDYVYQIAAHGVRDITRYAALPAEIRRAVVVQGGELTKDFDYLKSYIEIGYE